jgi:hypothetical protein
VEFVARKEVKSASQWRTTRTTTTSSQSSTTRENDGTKPDDLMAVVQKAKTYTRLEGPQEKQRNHGNR